MYLQQKICRITDVAVVNPYLMIALDELSNVVSSTFISISRKKCSHLIRQKKLPGLTIYDHI